MICDITTANAAAKTIGGKAYHLLYMSRLKEIKIPRWICLDTEFFYAFLGEHKAEYKRLLSKGTVESGEEICAVIKNIPFPDTLKSELFNALNAVFPGSARLAVRSSATDEDSSDRSFAGMMESYLNVEQNESIIEAIKNCWLSCFSARAMKYRAQNGGVPLDLGAAVIIQEMVTPELSGVIFTIDPHTNNPDEIYISIVKGLGEQLVSGSADSEDYVLDCFDELTQRGGDADEELLKELARQARIIEDSYEVKRGCDIEFAVKDGQIYILQCRPIASFSHINKRLERTILDNSNIIESYSGVTTPLTFTFAQEVYGKIYRQTLRTFFIPDNVIESIGDDLDHMLAFYENKVYYRLNSWYKMTSLYPRYEQNKQYMERMMGVKTPLKETSAQSNRRLVKIYIRFLYKMLRMKRDSKRFLERFNAVTAPYTDSYFIGKTNAEALKAYDELEGQILNDFTTPIANDMGAMVFFGLLTDNLKKHGVEDADGLLSDILSRQGNVESAEQTAMLLDIVSDIKADDKLSEQFLSGTFSPDSDLQLAQKLTAYIDRFGARGMDELKLETVTVQEDPSFLYKTIENYLRIEQPQTEPPAPVNREGEIYSRYGFFGKRYVKRLIKITKYFIRNRESLRLRRTYVYAIVRKIYLQIGKNLAADGLIEHYRDVFFLEKGEIAAFTNGEDIGDLRALIRERKQSYEENKAKEVYERMYFYGEVKSENMLPVFSVQEVECTNDSVLRGTPGGGKAVEGVVKLVTEPTDADINGFILMAKRTDPGWTILFPMVKAIIIERGSVLSHSAVIAREMGIPLVVGVRGLTDRVPDGARVRVDGISGTIEILEETHV